jgi:hypothetical protein
MSVHVMSWVLRNSEARLGDRLVLLVLADHAREDGSSAWPSVATIAHEAHLSVKQVQRCLASLRRDERIVQTGQSRNGTNVYTVVMEERRSRGDILSGATNPTHKGDRMSPEPSLVQPSDTSLAPAARERNEIWDALTVMFGEPTTRPAQKLRGQIASELRSAGATGPEILARGKRWPRHFETATLTETALLKHWDRLGRKPLRAGGR